MKSLGVLVSVGQKKQSEYLSLWTCDNIFHNFLAFYRRKDSLFNCNNTLNMKADFIVWK